MTRVRNRYGADSWADGSSGFNAEAQRRKGFWGDLGSTELSDPTLGADVALAITNRLRMPPRAVFPLDNCLPLRLCASALLR